MTEPEDYLNSSQRLPDLSAPPPLFDDIAAAMAQPVQPLHSNPFRRWLQSVEIKKIFTRRMLALAIVIASGVVAGAAGGAMLVKHDVANDAAFADQTKTPSTNAASAPDETAFQATTAAEAGAFQFRPRSRVRSKRGRGWIPRGQSSPAAYKVATIR